MLKYRDYVEIECVDQNGDAIADREYRLHLANGEVRTGNVDSNGCKKEENVPPGPCRVEFPPPQEEDEVQQEST